MYLSKNIQLLRKQRRVTQEQLAEQMNVSRQTISKWESGEMTPELPKLLELCELFSCKLDALVRPSPGDLPNPGIEPRSPALQADALPS